MLEHRISSAIHSPSSSLQRVSLPQRVLPCCRCISSSLIKTNMHSDAHDPVALNLTSSLLLSAALLPVSGLLTNVARATESSGAISELTAAVSTTDFSINPDVEILSGPAADAVADFITSADASEVLSGPAAEAFAEFLTNLDTLGPAGPALYIVLVMLLEMVPLLPTQPLSLASGLLFGPLQGALVMLAGVSLAANNAFWISRGVGRKLAEKIIDYETEGEGKGEKSAVAIKIEEVQEAIKAGGPIQQMVAVLLLRLTPIVPFSASNYVLGLTSVNYPSYIVGTVIGMSGWAILYSGIGAGARGLLDSGADIPTLLADLGERASGYSSIAIKGSVVGAAVALVAFVGSNSMKSAKPADGSPHDSIRDR